MDISIVDRCTNMVLFHRMCNAKVTSIDIANSKAFTAAGHKKATRAFASYAGPAGPAFGLHASNQGRFSIVAGGIPVTDTDGDVIGAVGVSGGSPDQDEEVAMAAVQAVEAAIRANSRSRL